MILILPTWVVRALLTGRVKYIPSEKEMFNFIQFCSYLSELNIKPYPKTDYKKYLSGNDFDSSNCICYVVEFEDF